MYVTKEDWLAEAVEKLRPVFKNVGCPVGAITVSIEANLTKGALGTCAQTSGGHHISIHSVLIAKTVLPVLVHEMLHAAVGLEEGHRGKFAQVGNQIGLWVSKEQHRTEYGACAFKLHNLLRMLEMVLGPYPSLDKGKQLV
jgi:hypothetical protein